MSISLVWKEPGLGSQQKLADVKRRAQGTAGRPRDRKGIGHCGTLDPFAEGILCVGMGEGTKLLSALVGLSKTYVAELVLGATSDTFDSESVLVPTGVDLSAIDEPGLVRFLASKIGRFDQIPPQHSAVKIGGRRAFDFARRGESVALKSRSVEIYAARHLSLSAPAGEGAVGATPLVWKFEVTVSSGTYIRAFARDWGQDLTGAPGTLRTLVRTELGPWKMNGEESERALSAADFATLIPTLALSSERVQGLRAYGRWSDAWLAGAIRHRDARGYLLVDEAAPGESVALLTPEMTVQRVFMDDPFGEDAVRSEARTE